MLTNYLVEKTRAGRDLTDEKTRQDIGKMAGWVGIVLNLSMSIAKIIIGFAVSSIAIMADGVNNVFDTVSSVTAIIGFKMAGKPADKEHPYGHGRIEYIAAVVVSMMVIIIGVQFIRASYDRIVNPEVVVFEWIPFWILIVSIGLKFWFSRFNTKVGRKIDSHTLLATGYDSMGDVVTTVVVLIPMITVWFTTFQVDGYIGVLVSLMIIYNGFKLFKETISPLIGNPPSEEMLRSIKETVFRETEIQDIHSIRYESYGGSRALMTMDVEMRADLTLAEAHAIIDRAERRVEAKFNVQLVLHPEPRGGQTDTEKKVLEEFHEFMVDHPEILSVHDFHIMNEAGGRVGYLDLIVAGDQGSGREEEIRQVAETVLRDILPITWQVTVDVDF